MNSKKTIYLNKLKIFRNKVINFYPSVKFLFYIVKLTYLLFRFNNTTSGRKEMELYEKLSFIQMMDQNEIYYWYNTNYRTRLNLSLSLGDI